MARPGYTAVPGAPRLHSTPLAALSSKGSRVTITADGTDRSRLAFAFGPCQAIRVTTEDCFQRPHGGGFAQRVLMEVSPSAWIEELKAALAGIDSQATFLDQTKHYLLDAGDEVYEVVAWEATWSAAEA
jgi:hypothetical protein